jgi:hypothetical protein
MKEAVSETTMLVKLYLTSTQRPSDVSRASERIATMPMMR